MNKTKICIICLMVLIIIFIVLFLMNKNKKKEEVSSFNIYFFNAGKADAIILLNNDKCIMIDTGYDTLASDILTYFKKNNINKLDYLILTHFDKDHIGSASKVIDNIEIDNILQSNYPKDSEYYNNYIDSITRKNIEPKTITNNYNFKLGDLDIVVNGPKEEYKNNESNNSSLITIVTYKSTSYLFMGDAENARIKDFLDEDDGTYDFVKLPHHGDYKKQYKNLLEEVKPKNVIITASKDEPDTSKTEALLRELKIDYYITKNGDINITSDGTNIVIKQ